jgi:hypothetical protein
LFQRKNGVSRQFRVISLLLFAALLILLVAALIITPDGTKTILPSRDKMATSIATTNVYRDPVQEATATWVAQAVAATGTAVQEIHLTATALATAEPTPIPN